MYAECRLQINAYEDMNEYDVAAMVEGDDPVVKKKAVSKTEDYV